MTDTLNDVKEFLQAVFGSDWREKAWLCNSGDWRRRQLEELDPKLDCYWCVGAIPWGKARKVENVEDVRALVIDDVGTKIPGHHVRRTLAQATAITLTSKGNSQWAYSLPSPVAPKAWRGFFAGVETALGQKLDGGDAVHLFRLPMGMNTKPGKRNKVKQDVLNHLTKLRSWNTPAPVEPSAPKAAATSGEKMGLDELRNYMAKLPNTFDNRDDWQTIGHQIKALCADDEDGFTVFDEWSNQWGGKGSEYNREKWEGFGAGGLKTKGGKLKDRIEKSRAFAVEVFDDNPPEPPPAPTGPEAVQFQLGEKKQILSTMENAARGLGGLGITCKYDAFHHRAYVDDERLTDHLVLLLRVKLNSTYGKDFGPVHIGDAIMALALLNSFNPVCDMLAGAEMFWDGVRRLDRLGPDYFHTADTALARACFRKVMIAAVRRARRPGCKFDQILVIESPEGWDKSTAWAVLAGEGNFSDADILGKDARQVQEELGDIWIHEIADLSGLTRAEIEHVKAFASRTNDRARAAYDRHHKDQLRQSIEVGTTNSDTYLLAITGNRRFWPFKLSARVETTLLRRDRLLLWGEAAVYESAGETLTLAEHLWAAAGEEQEKRRAIDTWEDELANLPEEKMQDWNGEQFISNLAVQEYLGGYRRQTFNSGSGRKIADIMRRLGWERCSRKMDGVVHRGYKRPMSASVSSSVISPVTKNPF